MKSVKLIVDNKNESAWVLATLLTKKYLTENCKADLIFEALPSSIESDKRSRCKYLFYGVLRNKLRISEALSKFTKNKPKKLLLSILLITGYEILQSSNHKNEKIIHYAVEQSKKLLSPQEVKFINAVLRKLPEAFNQQSPEDSLSIYFSHPQWMNDHWIKLYGLEATKALYEWNQRFPTIYLYSRHLPQDLKNSLIEIHPNAYSLADNNLYKPEIQTLLKEGKAYIKDISTLHSVEALDPKPGEHILDLCAAPGGKTFDCLQRMGSKGLLVAVDLPSHRIERLRENLAPFKGDALTLEILESDVLALEDSNFHDKNLPPLYDGVLLDAPCSNTGVIQRRPDVRWRLKASDLKSCAELQLPLLVEASKRVKPQGRIVYSTCSIDPEENEQLVHRFLESEAGAEFTLQSGKTYCPWIDQHDGAGVFLLKRNQ